MPDTETLTVTRTHAGVGIMEWVRAAPWPSVRVARRDRNHGRL